MGEAKARAEDELARVQDALAITEESRPRAEVEATSLDIERTSLLLEIRAAKDWTKLPFSPRPVKTKKPWKRTTRRL